MNSKTLLEIDLPFPNRFVRILFQSTTLDNIIQIYCEQKGHSD